MGYDDSLDAFGIHGVGGTVGAILLSFFIRESWMTAAAAATEAGTWTVAQQLGVQVAAVSCAALYAGAVTLVLVVAVQKVFGFRADGESELSGLDHSFHGEHGYGLLNIS